MDDAKKILPVPVRVTASNLQFVTGDIKPLTVTENGTYEAGKNAAFNPVVVNVDKGKFRQSIRIELDRNGVYDMTTLKSLRYGKTVALKDKIDVEELLEVLRREGSWDGSWVSFIYSSGTTTDGEYVEQEISLNNYDDLPTTVRYDDYIESEDTYINYLYFTREYLERFEMGDEEEGWYVFDYDEEVPRNKASNLQMTFVAPDADDYTGWAVKEAVFYLEKFVFKEPIIVDAIADSIRVATPNKMNMYFDVRGQSANQLFSKVKYPYLPPGLIEYDDTSFVTSMISMFSQCTLKEIPLFNTQNVEDMSNMFQECANIKEIPLFDTRKVKDMGSMAQYCYKLELIPSLDMREVDDAKYMLSSCKMLTNCWLKNIKTSLQVGSGTSWGHLLTVESLIHLIYQLRDTGELLAFTVGSANLEKLEDIYVRLVDITDEMREKDDLIDEKLPFEVCESTDEGAMWIVDYVMLKNWELQ